MSVQAKPVWARWCRVCGGLVTSDDAWVELPRLGRFWLCPRHLANASFTESANVGYLYYSDKQQPFSLGPYPYDGDA